MTDHATLDAHNFGALSRYEGNGSALRRALRICAPAMSKEETRYYLQAIHLIELQAIHLIEYGAHLLMVATDGHRMHTVELAPNSGNNAHGTIKGADVKAILAALSSEKKAKATSWRVDLAAATLSVGDDVYSIDWQCGQIDLMRVRPRDAEPFATVAVAEMMEIAVAGNAARILRLEVGEAPDVMTVIGRAHITARYVETADIEADTHGRKGALGLNRVYIADALRPFRYGKVTFSQSADGYAGAPVRLTIADAPDVDIVIMPCRI